jgi:hypothetical protein
MTFDFGKWFDQWEKKSETYSDFLDKDMVLQFTKEMRFSLGEELLKEWFSYIPSIKFPYHNEYDNKHFETIGDYFKDCLGLIENSRDANIAVSLLGEEKCLELLRKWWNER